MTKIDYNKVASKWHMIKTNKEVRYKCQEETELVHLDSIRAHAR
jgi:hypothetical protein